MCHDAYVNGWMAAVYMPLKIMYNLQYLYFPLIYDLGNEWIKPSSQCSMLLCSYALSARACISSMQDARSHWKEQYLSSSEEHVEHLSPIHYILPLVELNPFVLYSNVAGLLNKPSTWTDVCLDSKGVRVLTTKTTHSCLQHKIVH